jgi:hypothetical protein
MSDKGYLVSIDLGAGEGAKIGLFSPNEELLDQTLLPLNKYGESAEELADALALKVNGFVAGHGASMKDVRAIGMASAGLFRSDGSYLLVANVPFLNNKNLKDLLQARTAVPVAIDNDANAGGLAEWSVLKVELLYWVFGGGWGGAWISRDGHVRFSALDWDGKDASLHYTNEPGYAIPLEKSMLKSLFYQVGASYDRFEQILIEEFAPENGVISGPSGNPNQLRAEAILSGPGRCRLFRALIGDSDFYERFLDIHEVREMSDMTVAGKHISKLSSMRVEAAVNSDRLFGKILAYALGIILKQAKKAGIPEGIPICLGGKPSYALPYFGPSAQRIMGAMGIMSYLRPSIIDERGSNANLVGGAVLACKAAASAGTL